MFDPWEYVEKYKSEFAHQVALFQWANMAANFGLTAANDVKSYFVKNEAMNILINRGELGLSDDRIPELKYMHAIHNQGHGNVIRGQRAKAEGLKKGVPDIFLPLTIETDRKFSEITEAFVKYDYQADYGSFVQCGLYIELKKPKVGKVSKEQTDWQTFLREQGFVCEICYGWIEAKDLILKYLKEGGFI